MSPIKTLFFFFALAIVAVFAGEHAPAKRAIIAPAAYPYAAYPYAAAAAYPYAAAAAYPYAAAPVAAAAYPYAAYPYAYGYDDGSYFPGKYGPLSK